MSGSNQSVNKGITRRGFLRASAVTAGAAIGLPTMVPASVFGANPPSERITIGCIGVGNMGTSDLKAFRGNPGAQVVAVCEVDAQRLQEAGKLAEIESKLLLRGFSRVAGEAGHRRGDRRHAGPLARADRHRGGPRPARTCTARSR